MFKVIIDTREQRPWDFPADRFEIDRRKLDAGDYSIAGLEGELAIERKSLGDFVSTVIHDWIRFRKELYRLAGYRVAVVVVEADVSDVMEQRYDTGANPNSVMGRAAEITIDHGIPVFWWGARRYCEPRVCQFLTLAAGRLEVRRG